MSNLIYKIKGTNGILFVYEDKIIISRKTFGGFAAFGIVGDMSLFYDSIQGIEYNSGFLRIIPKGVVSKTYNIFETAKAQKDNYVIMLTPFNIKKAKKICEIISKKVLECKSTNNVVNEIGNASKIREYKKLLDDGIITQEEFERKKQELLK